MKFPSAFLLLIAAFSVQAESVPDTAPVETTKAEPAVIEQRIGELGFRVMSLRVSERDQSQYYKSTATIALRIHNYGRQPIALNYNKGSGSFVNERGYTWNATPNNGVRGIGIADSGNASIDYVIDAGGDMGVTLALGNDLHKGQTAGNEFDFQATFASYEDIGEGRVRRIRSYPVSMVGLKKSSIAEQLSDAPREVGDSLKKAFGGLFGK